MQKYNITWNRHDEEEKYVVGFLIHSEVWNFFYNIKIIEKVIDKGFRPFPELPDISQCYVSKDCFKTFKNRLNNNLLTDNIKCELEGDYNEKKRCRTYSKNI